MSSSSGQQPFPEHNTSGRQSGFGSNHWQDADLYTHSQPTLPRRSQSDRASHFPSGPLPRHDHDLPPLPQPELSPEARRASLIAMDRKRRLTGSSHETGRRRTTTGGFTNRDNRYYPNSPRRSSHRSSNEDVHPSRAREVIDLTSSSPPRPEPQRPDMSRIQRTSSNSSRYVVPHWQPDADVAECPICHRQFGWLFRKHHCRKCGRVVCNDCSPHRITIPRQYIVHPPGYDEADVPRIDLTRDDEDENDTGLPSPYRRRGSALGGGEKVRLCNPCVPDPQPELQTVLREGPQRIPVAPPPLPEPLRSAPAGISSFSQMQALASREAVQNRRSMGMLPHLPHPGRRLRSPDEDDDSGSSPDAYTSASRRHVMNLSSRHPPMHSRFHSLDSRQAPLPALPPFAAHSSQRTIDFARAHNIPLPPGFEDALFSGRLGQPSSSSATQPQPTHMPSRRRIKEEDICPICRHELPPKGPDDDETERENHIMECISQHDSTTASAPTSSSAPIRTQQFGASGLTLSVQPARPVSPPPARPPQFFRFTATEKDCGPAEGTDGEMQECSICMVEYEVGDKLIRLECWCKFHEDCIVSWFGRRAECPVHKLS